MEEDIKECIILLRKAMQKVDGILTDCPDKQEARLLEKAFKEMTTAMEYIVSAKNYQNDKLYESKHTARGK